MVEKLQKRGRFSLGSGFSLEQPCCSQWIWECKASAMPMGLTRGTFALFFLLKSQEILWFLVYTLAQQALHCEPHCRTAFDSHSPQPSSTPQCKSNIPKQFPDVNTQIAPYTHQKSQLITM